MGYELHITRQEHWFGKDIERQIFIEDWKDYARVQGDDMQFYGE